MDERPRLVLEVSVTVGAQWTRRELTDRVRRLLRREPLLEPLKPRVRAVAQPRARRGR